MSWIKTIDPDKATGKLKEVYDRVSTPNKRVDNILKLHSLRPHTLEGNMALYKSVLHHQNNSLPQWFLETIGIYVSILNQCSYCIEHHCRGLQRLLQGEEPKVDAILAALVKDDPKSYFSGKELILLQYARILTITPGDILRSDITVLQNNLVDDGEILEVNQVVAYFAYANRTVLGLGGDLTGDELGLSPSNRQNIDDWSHL